ncbi:MAG: universal stress protein [Phaeodactylibacter sp.]|uniref:universal stress protein n=1 Tax=Phaeodactylibacter sp. TaxID=1940289 RepID=UPI0032EF5484
MVAYKSMVFGLDLTDMDQVLLRYARFLCNTLPGIEKVYFQHNIRFDYPEELEVLMEELESPLSELIGEELEEQIETHFLDDTSQSAPDVDWEVMVTEGSSTAQEIVKIANAESVDLIVLGKKLSYKGSGQVAEKVLRQTTLRSDLLSVPETAPHVVSRIVVPIDFSQASKRAMMVGHRIAKAVDGVLTNQHVYIIPMHYFPFIPVQGFRKSMKEEAEAQHRRFRRSLPEDLQEVPCVFTYSEDRTTAQAVYDFAIQKNKDWVVIGSKGRSNLPAMLLGSTAIQLLNFEFHIPVLVVR